MEFIEELLGWYLAPWRRIGRKEFNTALLVASLPGLVMMFIGFGDMTSSVFNGLGQLGQIGQGGDPAQMLNSLQGLMAPEPLRAVPFDWGGLINGVLFTMFIPFCRMRLRDMGWYGWREVVWTVLVNASVVAGLVTVITGWNVLPWGWVFGLLNFGGYLWLAMAKGKPRPAAFEKVLQGDDVV